MLGLPDRTAACLFDLDGVLTRTASVHAAAWKEMFDGYLRERADRTGEPFVPFDIAKDYGPYVDGKKRADGTRAFLRSRGIELPEGGPDDPPDAETVRGLGTRKNALVLKLIEDDGVERFDGSIDYVRAARAAGLKTAVVSSSANTVQVLEAAGIAGLFDARVDGVVAAERNLPGKPAPDTFLAAARELDVPAERAAVFEDALAGVEAGRGGAFGYVVGVDRVGGGHARELAERGADVVVEDLSELMEDENA
ncbi:beta-phosphoglucomutase family hydrolase [Actinomadura sp. WMMB 499]|uniref:beta-phosphoglucomutase family hydrolase n=1 Tax=Actinomadura sp. WMMB 499 TaxID=1219491 RepID=UPI0012477ABE|nr:beta-phosphoglucomutase family hydrolase [Actinomadura sp. WMMB 499]QFG26023.1 beta-phosphoglucomutase family hydrolase [Actinomadura sp. WMMB 499]